MRTFQLFSLTSHQQHKDSHPGNKLRKNIVFHSLAVVLLVQMSLNRTSAPFMFNKVKSLLDWIPIAERNNSPSLKLPHSASDHQQ